MSGAQQRADLFVRPVFIPVFEKNSYLWKNERFVCG